MRTTGASVRGCPTAAQAREPCSKGRCQERTPGQERFLRAGSRSGLGAYRDPIACRTWEADQREIGLKRTASAPALLRVSGGEAVSSVAGRAGDSKFQ